MLLDIPEAKFRLTDTQRGKLATKSGILLKEANRCRRKVKRRLLAEVIGYYQSCAPAL